MHKKRLLVSLFAVIGLLFQPFVALGQVDEFNYELIVSDAELTDYQSMTKPQIQHFLEQKGGYIANYFFAIDEWYYERYPNLPYPIGSRISAAEHIYNAANRHRINPKFLLVMLQKEQSLVEDTDPKPTQLDWAMGYGCFDGQPCNERWRGFKAQVNSTAEQFRYYYDNIHEYSYRPGKTSTIDGTYVTPQNTVTAALYNYTPHLHGNKLFRTIWDRYFLSRLPDGTLVKVEGDPTVWLLKNSERRAFTNELALVSRYNPELIVPISQPDLEQYTRGVDIDFAAYSLLRNEVTGQIYLLTPDNKRLISSVDVFRSLGFNPEEVEDVDPAQLVDIPDGSPITYGDSYPTGAVLKDAANGRLYFVEAGRKYQLKDESLAAVNYPNLGVATVASEELSNYPTGFPVRIKDGLLVKGSSPDVYVISDGYRRHIDSEEAFNSIGYKWTTIQVVTDDVLNLHAEGEPISAL